LLLQQPPLAAETLERANPVGAPRILARKPQSLTACGMLAYARTTVRTHIFKPAIVHVHMPRLFRLAALAIFAVAVALASCTREPPPAPPEPEPVRERFHAARPLRIVVHADAENASNDASLAWLARELRFLLLRGQLRVAPPWTTAPTFALDVAPSADGNEWTLKLLAPDETVEREITLPRASDRLANMQAFARALPRFLEAPQSAGDWTVFLGTNAPRAYDSYLRGAEDVFGASAQGLTRPVAARAPARTIERMEALTRSEPKFARAWAALATAYLSMGGADWASLTELAEAAAERALALDESLSEAYAALGVVDLRRNEWLAAEDKLERALALDEALPTALEGMACLLADSGHMKRSLPHARRAVALQPRNAGARECLTYAEIATGEASANEESAGTASVARVRALAAFLQNDAREAERLLRRTMPRAEFEIWAGPTLQAARNRRLIPEALKAITQAANDGYIDPAVEILCGAALKQPEFVFNRIARLARTQTHAPLRVLWLPHADFLRSHARFEEAIGDAGLTSYWHGSGPPDICASEPHVYGCNLRRERKQ
jgi:tetratricopeptide (TPR) repeat protein